MPTHLFHVGVDVSNPGLPTARQECRHWCVETVLGGCPRISQWGSPYDRARCSPVTETQPQPSSPGGRCTRSCRLFRSGHIVCPLCMEIRPPTYYVPDWLKCM